MRSSVLSTVATTVAILASTVVADVDPIVIKGSKFFYKSNGTQFFMKGIAYQEDISTNGSISGADLNKYVDPLADVAGCTRDIPALVELQTNTIRVYAIDPTKDHDACMKMLGDAGIYVIADLSQPALSINRDDAAWNDDLYERYTAVVDALAPYDNTLGFFAGNEVSNAPNNTDASAFVKAAVRDTKQYIKTKNYRTIGVGYATNDDADIRQNLAKYFNCGDASESIDFWGYNIYSWCGDSSFKESGFDVRTKEFEDYNVPVFFAEYGCNSERPRLFSEVGALYGSEMTDVWSGGIVYMYFEEANEYGLVKVKGNELEKLGDFSSLSSQIAKATPSGVDMGSYNPTNTAPAECPAVASTWAAVASPLPPSVNPALCTCMMSSLSCAVSDNVDEEKYGDLFGEVCGYGTEYCSGIAHNATTGKFGAYSMCNAKEQLSYAFNVYASSDKNKNNGNACDFNGAATQKSPASLSEDCKSLVSQAGTDGQGTVTSVPTPGGAGAGGSSSSTGASSALTVPSIDFGFVKLGLYVACATLAGASMIIL
ncbi:putative 1,3-beta-glucanosyltransferase [Eremomyces bilateralis CBS 781.70]|uniref:1,3-beta-glucanosyltransferase n=1 Tax=Eremomyces bilateralis CBS 781.70 TaxID=1392243 RepID=A0A6G1FRH9_9PEZI|nr:putative 1,3-beta-glucanosyltransferase [Eremomyces bilateralis CBS 781.70]KAF1808383.1 putative 1,3-beta-glucanosyltransferase [Eremomyces bilateralis CBS 781.70]